MGYKKQTLDVLKEKGAISNAAALASKNTYIHADNGYVGFAQQILDFVYNTDGTIQSVTNVSEKIESILSQIATIQTVQATGVQYRGVINLDYGESSDGGIAVRHTLKKGDLYVVNNVAKASGAHPYDYSTVYHTGDVLIVREEYSWYTSSDEAGLFAKFTGNDKPWDIIQGNLTNEDALVTADAAAPNDGYVFISDGKTRKVKYTSKQSIVADGWNGLYFDGTYNKASNPIVTKNAMVDYVATNAPKTEFDAIGEEIINALS